MALGRKLKPRLSGAARRRIARQKDSAVAAAAKPKKIGEYIERDPEQKHNVRDQWSHDRWRLEMRLVYLEMRSKKIPMADGTSLIWAADINARLAKMAEELAQLQSINDQLTAARAGQPLLTAADLNGAALHIDSEQRTGDEP
jgi:hypothetical protein